MYHNKAKIRSSEKTEEEVIFAFPREKTDMKKTVHERHKVDTPRQSAKLFLQSSDLGLPPLPHPPVDFAPPPFGPRGRPAGECAPPPLLWFGGRGHTRGG